MNTFEIAILRILIKKNRHPIPIHSLIEGFPDGSENHVVFAISNLKNSRFVSVLTGYPKEEEYIIFNLDKKDEILKIIDPLNLTQNPIRAIPVNNLYDKKSVIDDKKLVSQKPSLKPIGIIMSFAFILVAGMFSNIIPTSDDASHILNSHDLYIPYKYHEAYGNKDRFHSKHLDAEFANLSFKDQNNETGQAGAIFHPTACHW